MSEKRRKLSGSAHRKLASERREKETNLLKPIKRVDSFFKLAEKTNVKKEVVWLEIQVILVIQAKIKTLSNTEQKFDTSLERVVRLY